MRKFKILLDPPFLQRFDDKILRNNPLIWSTRIYYVLYYTLLTIPIAFLLDWFLSLVPSGTLLRVDGDATSLNGFVVGFSAVLLLVPFFFWGSEATAFRVDREPGYTSVLRMVFEVFLFWVCGIFIMTPFLIAIAKIYSINFFTGYSIAIHISQLIFLSKYLRIISSPRLSYDKMEFPSVFMTILTFAYTCLLINMFLAFLLNSLFLLITRSFLSLGNTSYFSLLLVLTFISTTIFSIVRIEKQKVLLEQSILNRIWKWGWMWGSLALFPLLVTFIVSIILSLAFADSLGSEITVKPLYVFLATLSNILFIPFLKNKYLHVLALPRG